MKNLLFTCGGLLTAAAAYLSYRHQSGIDPVTRLPENMIWNYLAILLALLTIIIWLVLAVKRLPRQHVGVKSKKEDKGEKTEKQPGYAADCLNKPLPGYAFAFYAASFLLYCVAVVFFVILTVVCFKPVYLLLVLTAIGMLAALVRAVLVYFQRRSAPIDALLLPMPLIFLAVFSLYFYTNVMKEPQTVSYALDILAITAMLFTYYGFFSHFFGRTAYRFSLFASLSASSLAAISYFSRAILFFTDKAPLGTAGDNLYSFLAELMLFASASIFGVSYAIFLWDMGKKPNKKTV